MNSFSSNRDDTEAPAAQHARYDLAMDAAGRVNAKRIAVNAASNYAYYALQALILLFLHAYIVRSVGKAEYSLWPLCRTCMSLSSLIQVALSAGTARFISYSLGKKDIDDIHRLTSTLFAALSVGGVIYLLVFTLIGWQFERIFDIPPGTEGIAPWTMILLGFAGAVSMPFAVFDACLLAAQQRVIYNLIRSGLLIGRLFLVVTVFEVAGPSLIWIAATQLLLSVGEALVPYWFAGRVFPWRRLRLRDCSWSTFRTVNQFSAFILIGAIAQRLYWDADIIIINKCLDPTWVAGYALCGMLLQKAGDLTRLSSGALAAPITVLCARGEFDRITNALRRVNRISVPMSGLALILLIFHGDTLMRLYVGEEFVPYAFLFPLIGFGLLLAQTQISTYHVPNALGDARIPGLSALVAALANLVISLILTVGFGMGLKGVALGTLTMLVIYRGLFWPLYMAGLLNLSLRQYVLTLIVLPLAHCSPSFCILAGGRLAGFGRDGVSLIGLVAAASIAQVLFSLRYGLNGNDRNQLRALFSRTFPGRTSVTDIMLEQRRP